MTGLRTGYTTGACAAAAAKAATLVFAEDGPLDSVDIPFPDGTRCAFQIEYARQTATGAVAAVRKSAGDDPDITDGVLVESAVAPNDGNDIQFRAGDGIGTVTKPGLQIPPGNPAINPGPRRMIEAAIREVTQAGITVTVSIPGGRELAAKTFNPRLGIADGLSILGTTGQVRPFSAPALQEALLCSMNVALACGVQAPVLVPGNIGRRAVLVLFKLSPEQVIEVSNEWGFMLDQVAAQSWERLLLAGHPGKMAKLAMREWNTHSAHSPSVLPFLKQHASALGIDGPDNAVTAEGFFEALRPVDRPELGNRLAALIQNSVQTRTEKKVAVILVTLAGELLGSSGDLTPWQ